MIYIGIDPGVHTGFATWDSKLKCFKNIGGLFEPVVTLYIHDVLQIIRNVSSENELKIYIEDARKRKWFGDRSESKLQGAGSIKRDCKIIEDACDCWGIELILVDPKSQKGLTKMSAEAFKKLTGWDKRTSSHARDAALLVWGR